MPKHHRMARLKKYGDTLQQNLSTFQTYINDTAPNSEYFRISEFKDTFTGGKNGFYIEGSEFLKPSTELKIQVLDVNGDPLYFEPYDGTPEYYYGIAKPIAVYVYEDTPYGMGSITILGELSSDKIDIPVGWQGVYNVKWQRDFKIVPSLPNEDRVLFYNTPTVEITELARALYSTTTVTTSQTGSVSGIPLVPVGGTSVIGFTLPQSYRLDILDGGTWNKDLIGTNLQLHSLGYSPKVREIITEKTAIVDTPYTSNNIVKPFTAKGYTASYTSTVQTSASEFTGSFAKFTLSNLETAIGDVARVKVYRKSESQLGDYTFVEDIQLESNELLTDLDSSTSTKEYYGLFTEPIINTYWASSSNATVTFNQSYLYDSAKIQVDSGTGSFHTTASFNDLAVGVEYTLKFNARCATTSSGALTAYLSGSNTVSGTPTTQEIIVLLGSTAYYQKTAIEQNIKIGHIDNAVLYFDVDAGTDWYVSDVSLKASQETSFSPDSITFIESVPRTLPVETFDFRFQFYDINNNNIPVTLDKALTFSEGNIRLAGQNAITSDLSNEFDLVATDAYGNSGSYVNTATTMSIYDGYTDVSNHWTFAVPSLSTGVTADISADNRSTKVTDLTVDTGTITFAATRTNYPNQTSIYKISKIKGGISGSTGTNGYDARSVALKVTPSTAITFNSAGTLLSPTTLAVTASAYNTSSTANYRFTYDNKEVQARGTSNLLTYSLIGQTFTTLTGSLEVELTEGADTTTIYARDEVAFVALKPGQNSIVVALSNTNHTFGADSTGSVYTYADSGTTIKVYEGTTALTYVTGTPTDSQWTVDTLPTGITVGAITGNTTDTATVAAHSAVTAASASITYTINAKSAEGLNLSATASQYFNRSDDGANAYNYSLLLSTREIISGSTYSPTSLTISSSYADGASTTQIPYAGVIRVTPGDGAVFTTTAGTSSFIYTLPAGLTLGGRVKIELFAAGGTTQLLDVETVPVLGQGLDGSAGVNARSVNLTSPVQAFAYNTGGLSPVPATTCLTASVVNTAGTASYLFYKDGVAQGSWSVSPYWTYTAPAAFADMPDKIEVCISENGGSTVLARDQFTIYGIKPGRDGVDSLSVILSNEAHTLPTTNTGVVTYAGSGTDITIYQGVSALTYNGVGTTAGTWTVAAVGTNITASSPAGHTTYVTYGDQSGMTQTGAYITYTMTGKTTLGVDFTLTKVQSFAKSVGGTDGAGGGMGQNARSIILTPSAYAIHYDTAGAETTIVDFTTQKFNTTGSAFTYKFTVSGSEKQFTTTSTYTLAQGDEPTIGHSTPVTVGLYEDGNLVASDSVTIYAVQDGSDTLTGYLTNTSHVVSALANGTVANFNNAGGTFKVYVGADDVTTSCTFSAPIVTSGLTTNIVAGTGVYSISALTVDSGSATYQAVIPAAIAKAAAPITITSVYSIAKSKRGIDAVFGSLTNDSVSIPATSDGIVTDFSSATGIFKMSYGSEDVTELSQFSCVATDCTGAIETPGSYWCDGVQVGNLPSSTNWQELSGITAAYKEGNSNYLWVLSDSPANMIAAVSKSNASNQGVWTLSPDPTKTDWEDINSATVTGIPYLYIFDFGNNPNEANSRGTGIDMIIHRVVEPVITGTDSSTSDYISINCVFPETGAPTHRDCEATIIDPLTGDIYIITKREAIPGVYKLPHQAIYTGIQTLTYMGKMYDIPDAITLALGTTACNVVSATINNSGTEIIVKNYSDLYLFSRDLVTQTIFQALQGTPIVILGYVGGGSATPAKSHPTAEPQGEGICFDELGVDLYSLSEYVDAAGSTPTRFPLFKYSRVNVLPTTISFQQGVSGYTGTEDTYIWDTNPDTQYGSAITFIADVSSSAETDRRKGLLKFDISSIPANAIIVGAKLDLNIAVEGQGWYMYKMLIPWSEESTYNSLGGIVPDDIKASAVPDFMNGVNLDTFTGIVRNNIPVSIIQGWIDGTFPNYGWLFEAIDVITGDGEQFTSSEDEVIANRPKLTLRYVLLGSTPGRYYVSSFDQTAVNGYLTLVGTYDGASITKTFSVSKAIRGINAVSVAVTPVDQSITANSLGNGSSTPIPLVVTAFEGGTAKAFTLGAPTYTNGLSGSFIGGTITFTKTASDITQDSASISIPVNYTDSTGLAGTQTLRAVVTKTKAATPVITLQATPQSQNIYYDLSTYAAPEHVTVTVNEGGSNYTYAASGVSTFQITSITGGTNSSADITPTTPASTAGITGAATVSYINSEGTTVTGKIIGFNVGVTAKGIPGAGGASGSAGLDGRTIALRVSPSAVIYFNDAGVLRFPTLLYLTAYGYNTVGAPEYQFWYDNKIIQARSTTDTKTFSLAGKTFDMLTGSLEVELYENGSDIVWARSEIALGAVKPGQSSIAVSLTNDNHTFQANSSGVVTSYVGSGTYLNVCDGTSFMSYTTDNPNPGQYKMVVSSIGITCGTMTPQGGTTLQIGNHSALTEKSASITYTVYAKSVNSGTQFTGSKVQSFTRTDAGIPGVTGSSGINARAVNLTTDVQAFVYTAAGSTPAPSTATITATKMNSAGTAYYDFLLNGSSQQNTTTGTYTYTPQASFASMPEIVQIKLREDSNSSTVLATDQITLVGIKPGLPGVTGSNGIPGVTGSNGTDSVSVILTNEAHTVPANYDGNSPVLTGAVTDVIVYEGVTNKTVEYSISKADSTGITSTLSTATVTITAMTADNAYVDITVAKGAVSVIKRFSLSKSKQGINGIPGVTGSMGVNARAVNLTTTVQAFVYTATGTTPSPNSATITATKMNSAGTAYYDFLLNGSSQQNTQTTTYTYTPQASFASMPETVEVRIREDSSSGTVLATDQITLTGIKPGLPGVTGSNGIPGITGSAGLDAYTVILSNEAHTLPTTNVGAVTYAGSGTSITVYKGIAELNSVGPTPSPGQFQVTAAVTTGTVTIGAQTITGNPAVFANHSAMTTDNAVITYTIYLENGTTIVTKQQSLAKSIQGTNGIPGVTGSNGATGPGFVSTGVWTSGRVYQYSVGDNSRRDVVLWSATGTAPYDTYYATKQAHVADAGNKPGNTTYWESLGTEDFFVAAKIAVFKESFVQNTLNIGTNSSGSSANISLVGGTTNPYMSIGQTTQGYNQNGVWVGIDSSVGKLSLKSATNGMSWDGSSLDVTGTIHATEGNIGNWYLNGGNLQLGISSTTTAVASTIGGSSYGDTTTTYIMMGQDESGFGAEGIYIAAIGTPTGTGKPQFSFVEGTSYISYLSYGRFISEEFPNVITKEFRINDMNVIISNANIDITETGAITSLSTLKGTTGIFTNLTDGYIPYHVSDTSGLANSPISISAGNIAISGSISSDSSITGSAFKKTGGTSTQFLKANGTVDSTTYAPTSTTATITSYYAAPYPGATPGKTGDMWVDGVNKKVYIATGATSYADWTLLN